MIKRGPGENNGGKRGSSNAKQNGCTVHLALMANNVSDIVIHYK